MTARVNGPSGSRSMVPICGEHFRFCPGAIAHRLISVHRWPLVGGFRCCFGGRNTDEASTAAAVFELDVAGDQSEERVVLTETHIVAGLVLGAALANQNRAGINQLAAEALHAKPLAV